MKEDIIRKHQTSRKIIDRDSSYSLGDFMVLNDIAFLPPFARDIKEFLAKREICSQIFTRFYDKDNNECILIISNIGKKVNWNQSHFKYYRAFTDVLSLLSIGKTDE